MDNEHREREWVQGLLRAGLGLSMVLMLLGLALKLERGDFSLGPASLSSVFHAGIPPGDRIMGLGVVVLAFTPVFRVFALLLLWSREKDWKFVAVSAIVLALLCVAILLGGG